MKKIISLLLTAAMLTAFLTSCAGKQTDTTTEATSSEADLTADAAITSDPTAQTESAKPTETAAETTSATTSSTTTTAPAESAETDEATVTTTAATEKTSAAQAEATSAETTTAAKTSATTTKAATVAVTTTKVATSTTTTTAAATSAAPTAERDGFKYGESAEKLIEAYDIDADERESYYKKIAGETTLPIIHVSTEDNARILSLDEYVNCLVDMFNCDEEYQLQAADGGIKVRGNSTAYYGEVSKVSHNQVPYRIKFNSATNMLGLNDGAKCKSWVLLKATWNVMPDYIAFTLADRIFGGEYYSSDATFTYVYVNEKFMGLYVLCEQNQINPNRVSINEVEKDYTGTDIGYFFEIDNYATEEEYYFTIDYCNETLTDLEGTERELVPAEYSFKNDIYSQKQVDYISDYVSNVYYIMVQAIKYNKYYTLDANNKLITAGNRYDNAYDAINAVLDINSTVDMYLLYEITHDYDCGEGSFFMAVDFSKDSKMKRLTFTAPWDFNWAYNDEPTKKYYAGAFNADSFVNQYGDRSNPWFILLMSTDWYQALVKEKWQKLNNAGKIDDAMTVIQNELDAHWDDFTVDRLYYSDNAQDLINWVKRRIRWLNKEWSE